MTSVAPLAAVTLLWLAAVGARPKPAPPPDPDEVAAVLLGRALQSDEAWRELQTLADGIGPRISGSAALDRAIAWGAEEMSADGLAVTKEPVMVPRWVRGPASLALTSPRTQPLQVLALGNSVSTPAGGITAEVLVVSTFDELDARAAEAKGRIVVWDAPFTDYGETVAYRWEGASRASKAGAVASLVRSVTNVSLSTPHTGNQGYGDGVTPIPAAAITTEVAETLHRMQDAGMRPTLHLELEAHAEADVPSANVVGELRGRERPDEIVVIGCHLDSWDVGQGAQDDGAGCVTVMAAGALLAGLPQAPRRTVRVVLFTNEENGLRGGKAYAEAHAGERIVAAMEDDTGSGRPLGFHVDVRTEDGREVDGARAGEVIGAMEQLQRWLTPLGATELTPGWSGADVGGLVRPYSVGLGMSHDMSGYWAIHHTEADTLDKVDPQLVRRNVAAAALATWWLAEVGASP